jgi:hypothetical protein
MYAPPHYKKSMKDWTIQQLESEVVRTTERIEYCSNLAKKERNVAQDPALTQEVVQDYLTKASKLDEAVSVLQHDNSEYTAEIVSREDRLGTRLFMYFYQGGQYSYADIKDVYFRNYQQLQESINEFLEENVDSSKRPRIKRLLRHYQRVNGDYIDWIMDEESYARFIADPDLQVVITVHYP